MEEALLLREPALRKQEREAFKRGIYLFNDGRYWDAHEAWEEVWQQLGNRPEDDWEILLRGLIQLAAGVHCAQQGKIAGARGHFAKSQAKLSLYPAPFLSLDLPQIIKGLRAADHAPTKLIGMRLSVQGREQDNRDS